MTKQEEIREGIWDIVADVWCDGIKSHRGELPATTPTSYVHDILTYLDSQGVAIKVNEGELPDSLMEGQSAWSREDYKRLLGQAGYTLTEPLI
jgi:hypothetical protein